MNSLSSPAPDPNLGHLLPTRLALAKVIDGAGWIVHDPDGKPGCRILSLHTTAAAATAMAKHLNDEHDPSTDDEPMRPVECVARAAIPAGLVSELDQVTMSLKNDPELLRAAAVGGLDESDTFSLIDNHPPHHEPPVANPFLTNLAKILPAIFQSVQIEAQPSAARRLAERLFEAMCLEEGGDTYRGEEAVQRMAEVCCQRALAFTRAADEAFKPDPTPDTTPGDAHAR